MLSEIIGWIVSGVTKILQRFWEGLAKWLNHVAADAVEKALGYGARQRMHRAIAVIDRLVNKIRNTATVYTKKNNYDTHFDKTTIVSECDDYEIGEDVLEEIRKKNKIVQEFEYRG